MATRRSCRARTLQRIQDFAVFDAFDDHEDPIKQIDEEYGKVSNRIIKPSSITGTVASDDYESASDHESEGESSEESNTSRRPSPMDVGKAELPNGKKEEETPVSGTRLLVCLAFRDLFRFFSLQTTSINVTYFLQHGLKISLFIPPSIFRAKPTFWRFSSSFGPKSFYRYLCKTPTSMQNAF